VTVSFSTLKVRSHVIFNKETVAVQDLHNPVIHISPITERKIPQVAYDKNKDIKEIMKYMPMQDRQYYSALLHI
jgi:hypothetical protein